MLVEIEGIPPQEARFGRATIEYRPQGRNPGAGGGIENAHQMGVNVIVCALFKYVIM